MSRIGKKPIAVPQGVNVSIQGSKVTVRGPKGDLTFELRPEVDIEITEGEVVVREKMSTKQSRALWGTTRSVLANLVQGVSQGFAKKLELQGLGYRAVVEGGVLVLSLGFSHPVKVSPPPGIEFKVEKNIITVSGRDKEGVGNIAARVRSLKKPEPYKGKGIRYEGEMVRKKAGKRAVAATK